MEDQEEKEKKQMMNNLDKHELQTLQAKVESDSANSDSQDGES